jgi:hypothetical protein
MKTATVYRLDATAIRAFGEVAFTGTFTQSPDNQIWDYFSQKAQACSTCYGGVRIEIQNSDRRN